MPPPSSPWYLWQWARILLFLHWRNTFSKSCVVSFSNDTIDPSSRFGLLDGIHSSPRWDALFVMVDLHYQKRCRHDARCLHSQPVEVKCAELVRNYEFQEALFRRWQRNGWRLSRTQFRCYRPSQVITQKEDMNSVAKCLTAWKRMMTSYPSLSSVMKLQFTYIRKGRDVI